jgi:hypothetical protein
MTHPNIKSVGWVLIQTARLHRFRMSEQSVDQGLYPGQVIRVFATAERKRCSGPTLRLHV